VEEVDATKLVSASSRSQHYLTEKDFGVREFFLTAQTSHDSLKFWNKGFQMLGEVAYRILRSGLQMMLFLLEV